MADEALPEDCQDSLRDSRLSRLLDYWRMRSADAAMPLPSAIDPVDFAYILGYITLVDVEAAPRRYRYRLDGSNLARISGIDYTGRYQDELGMPEYTRFVAASYDRVVETGQPYAHRTASELDRKPIAQETLILPLGEGETVTRLIVAVIPDDRPLERGNQLI